MGFPIDNTFRLWSCDTLTYLHLDELIINGANRALQAVMHWRRTKVETTGAIQDYETLISRLFETFFDFETKKQVVLWHQWHHLVRRH